jgi:hypothetical protein
MLVRAWPRMRLTWTTSRWMSMIRWLAQVVKAHPPAVDIESGIDGGAAEHPLGDIVMEERRTLGGRKHVVGAACESGVALVVAEDCGELSEQRDLADGGARLRRDPVRRHAAATTRELMADTDHASDEVHVLPRERGHLR